VEAMRAGIKMTGSDIRFSYFGYRYRKKEQN